MSLVINFSIDKLMERMLSITSSQNSLGKLAIFLINPKQIATQMFFEFLWRKTLLE